MKKILLVLLLSMMLFAVTKQTYAEANTLIYNGSNLLDLTKFKRSNQGSIFGYCDELNIADSQTKFTLIMSYDYLKENLLYVLDHEFEIELSDGFPIVYNYIDDSYNQIIYVEFIPTDSFTIFSMPFILDAINPNYEVMMYIGSYSDFNGFEPHLSNQFERTDYAHLNIDYDTLFSTQDIKNMIRAYDFEHQEIEYLVIRDEYSQSDMLPGDYEMLFLAEINLVKKYFLLSITVLDTKAPIIIGDDVIHVNYGSEPPILDLLSHYTVFDNVDQNLTYEDFYLEQDQYSSAATIGSYEVLVSVIDSSNNIGNKEITIYIDDVTAPVISGPNEILLYSSDDAISNVDILSKYSALDDVDGNTMINMSVNGYNQNINGGVYEIILQSIDAHLNQSTKTIYVHVIENREPVFEFDTPIIELTVNQIYTDHDLSIYLKNYMIETNQDIKNIEIRYNEYLNHENEVGSYYVYFTYDIKNESYTSRMLIEVIDENDSQNLWYLSLLTIPLASIVLFVAHKKKKII